MATQKVKQHCQEVDEVNMQDIIEKNELQMMIRNSYSKFKEKFEFKKLATVLKNKSFLPFDETKYDLNPVLLLLQ